MKFTCDSCGHTIFREIPYPCPKENPLGFKTILQCQNCGFAKVSTEITENELNRFYQQGHYWESVASSKGLEIHYQVQCQERTRKVKDRLSFRESLKVLDIGAGQGFIFDVLLEEKKVEYFFTEPDDKYASNILSKADLNHKALRLKDMADQGEKVFDVIFLNQVLEHVLSPQELLEKIRPLLKSDGLLYVEVPHADFKFKKDVFPHTLFFNAKSLGNVLEKAGFKLVALSPFGYKSRIWTRVLTKVQSICLKMKLWRLVALFDSLLFEYRNYQESGGWLFALAGPK